jgi:hypothetical protein
MFVVVVGLVLVLVVVGSSFDLFCGEMLLMSSSFIVSSFSFDIGVVIF